MSDAALTLSTAPIGSASTVSLVRHCSERSGVLELRIGPARTSLSYLRLDRWQLDEDDISQGFLSVVCDSHSADIVISKGDPFMVGGVPGYADGVSN